MLVMPTVGIRIKSAVLTHCQMNGYPCSNQELFEHGFEFENTLNEPRVICMMLYMEVVADHTDHHLMLLFVKKLRPIMVLCRHYYVQKSTADFILFRGIQCKKSDILMF